MGGVGGVGGWVVLAPWKPKVEPSGKKGRKVQSTDHSVQVRKTGTSANGVAPGPRGYIKTQT